MFFEDIVKKNLFKRPVDGVLSRSNRIVIGSEEQLERKRRMKMKNNGFRQSHRIFAGLATTLSFALLALISPVKADDGNGLVAPSGAYNAPPGTVAPSGTYMAPAGNFSPNIVPGNPYIPEGHLPVVFSASVGEIYDDNIFISPVKTSDYITQINLMAEYKVGNDKAIDAGTFDIFYAPSFDIYANHSAQDSFNNYAGAQYQYRFSKLTLGIQQTYDRNSSTSAPAGTLVTTSNYVTTASANYFVDEKFSVVGTFNQKILDYETAGFSDSNEWVGDLYFLYKYDSKLTLGFGPKFGWLDVTLAPNQTYQDFLGRADYAYSKKLSFSLYAGAEVREYQGPASYTRAAGVFNLSAIYQPFTNTTLTLACGRQFEPSYNFYGQNYMASRVSLTGRQRFLQNFYYNLQLGYENDAYQSAGVGLTGPARNDNYYYITTGFDWTPNNWLTSSIFYKYQTDISNFSGFTFNDNQVGISVGFKY